MADYGYRLQFAPRVARVLSTFTLEEQDEVDRLFGLIQLDPVPDPAVKVVLQLPPAVFTVYHTPKFWIAYHVVGADINVVNVGRASTKPTAW